MQCRNHFKNNECYSYHFYYRLGYAEGSGTVITQFLSNSMQLYSSKPLGMLEACCFIKEEAKAPKMQPWLPTVLLQPLSVSFDCISEDKSSKSFLVNTCFIFSHWVSQEHEEGLLAAAGNDRAEKKINSLDYMLDFQKKISNSSI